MVRAIVTGGIVAALLFLAMGGCSSDTNGPSGVYKVITLDPQRLPTLKSGLIYEGWVANLDKDSNWVNYQSFGKFFWDEHDFRFLDPNDLTRDIGQEFKITNGSVYDYNTLAITLEPFPTDPDPKPSPTIMALGGIDPDKLTVMKFPRDFGEGSNYFSVATFSDGNWVAKQQPQSNEDYGLWFVKLSVLTSGAEIYEPGLALAALPDTGYLYEGWVILDGGDTVSTGKFFSPDYIDYDNSHCQDGTIPNFPGEDFLLNRPEQVPAARWPLNMFRGGMAMVTLEPNPDNDLARPSPFVIVSGNLPIDTTRARKGFFTMGYKTDLSLPIVSATFK